MLTGRGGHSSAPTLHCTGAQAPNGAAGQTPIKLAKTLSENNIPILGTQFDSIDLAEDRKRFKEILIKENLKQADSGVAKNKNESFDFDKGAEDLRLAQVSLGKIVGKVDVEAILGSIFNDFCIGK